ncbi:MAG: hypothetical protein AAGI38_24760 [Bacteroidota bacterium]
MIAEGNPHQQTMASTWCPSPPSRDFSAQRCRLWLLLMKMCSKVNIDNDGDNIEDLVTQMIPRDGKM